MIFKENSVLVDDKDYSKIAAEERSHGQEFIPLRSLVPYISDNEMKIVLKEFQTYNWVRRTKFCGICGTLNAMDKDEGCKLCPRCGEKNYPYLFPAVIVLIVRDDRILLAHNVNFPGDMHSVIAGFVDLGESLEDTVIREVREEVGIEIKNIEYFSSQNWGFTSSLMLGFKAEYSSGDIKVDGIEIDRAGWFSIHDLPELPPKHSIGRALVDSFVSGHD